MLGAGLCLLVAITPGSAKDGGTLIPGMEDLLKLVEMEKKYIQTVKFAHKSKSYKHMFSPYFWAAKYFMEFGKKDKSLEYCKLTIKNANKYCDKYKI